MKLKFLNIEKSYLELERRFKVSGKGNVFLTNTGIYGVADIEKVFKFFKDIHLEEYDCFLDLGSGDGRIVLVASLFTKAVGVESDKELVRYGEEIKNKLGLNAEFLCEDFLKMNLDKYDILFINPDKEFDKGLDDKLSQEMKGKLFLYNQLFKPKKLKRSKAYWYDQIPIIEFERE
jgi:hypothetical protein